MPPATRSRVLRELVDGAELSSRRRARRERGLDGHRRRARPRRLLARRDVEARRRDRRRARRQHPLRARALHGAVHDDRRARRRPPSTRSRDTPAAAMGLQPGDRIVSIGGTTVAADEISRAISGSAGKPLTVVVVRDGERVTLGPGAAAETTAPTGSGSSCAARVWRCPRRVAESFRITGLVTKEIVKSIGRLVTGRGARTSPARSASCRARPTPRSRAPTRSSGCWG